METVEKKIGTNMKVWLSTLWIFVSVNYIFCDVLSLMEPGALKDLVNGTGAIQMTQGLLLAAGISLEIPFVMIVLSRALNYKINRGLNIVAGILMVIYQLASFFAGPSALHYIFFSIIEILGDLLIAVLAWKWRNPEAKLNSNA